MTNEEKFKTPKEREKAFDAFCGRYKNCYGCPARDSLCNCKFTWLTLEAEEKNPLPCPFCGGSASVIEVAEHSAVVVRCDFCNVSTGNYDIREEAIAAWNRRVK